MSDATTLAAINSSGDKNQRANLFQIATRTRTFLVEVRDLVDRLDQERLDRFGKLVLFNDDLIKLGYNFEQDSHRLTHSFWAFQHRFCEFTQTVVNLDQVASDLDRRFNLLGDGGGSKSTVNETANPKDVFLILPEDQNRTSEASESDTSLASSTTNSLTTPTSTSRNVKQSAGAAASAAAGKKNSGAKPKGLSKLTQQLLGKPLDKRECMSNWQNKPLRDSQRRYAALDAFVLIQIHDLFAEKLRSIGADVDYITSRNKHFI